MTLCDVHDDIHFAGHTGVMNRHDGLGARRDGRLDQGLVNVERIGANIDKHRDTTSQHKGIGGRNEGV